MRKHMNLQNLIVQAIGLEHVLELTRDQIYHESIIDHKEILEKTKTLEKFANNKKDRKDAEKIINQTTNKIKEFERLTYDNKCSKVITKKFNRANRFVDDFITGLFKDKTHDLYAEFSDILHSLIQLKKRPKMKAAILIESEDGNFEYKNKKYKVVCK